MSEEREFWGIELVPKPREGNPLLSARSTAPDRSQAYLVYVFDSREEAERFASEAYHQGTGDILGPNFSISALEQLLKNIRKIEPNEIPQDHDVLLNGDDTPVKWSELAGKDAPPVA